MEHLWLLLLFFSPFFRLNAAEEALFVVDTGGPYEKWITTYKNL